MSDNFDRQYRLIAGKAGGTGFEIGHNDLKHPRALHISFSLEKSDSESSNSGRIAVWNLNKTHLAILERKDCVVSLKAGYGNNITMIFTGNVTDITTQRDGADTMTELEVVDGRVALRDTYISVSYNGEVYANKIAEGISGSMGLTLVCSKEAKAILSKKKLAKGFSFVGAGKAALNKICTLCKLTWSIQNGVLQIRKPNETITTRVYVLNNNTGLLDIPKKITMASKSTESKDGNKDTSENKTDKKSQKGWEVRYLMNGTISVNDYVKLESKSVKGYFRVKKLTIDGDNLEGEWTCTAQLLEVGKK